MRHIIWWGDLVEINAAGLTKAVTLATDSTRDKAKHSCCSQARRKFGPKGLPGPRNWHLKGVRAIENPGCKTFVANGVPRPGTLPLDKNSQLLCRLPYDRRIVGVPPLASKWVETPNCHDQTLPIRQLFAFRVKDHTRGHHPTALPWARSRLQGCRQLCQSGLNPILPGSAPGNKMRRAFAP